MSHEAHRDHGVAAGAHWLLDEELVAARTVRLAKTRIPAPLLQEVVARADERLVVRDAAPPRRNFALFLAGLSVALLVYAVLRNAPVDAALEDLFVPGDEGQARVTATFDEPGAREIAALRALLGDTAAPALNVPERASTKSSGPSAPAKPTKSSKPNPPPPTDEVLPPPPPPAILELPPLLEPPPPLPETPTLPEAPRLPDSPSVELPSTPELP